MLKKELLIEAISTYGKQVVDEVLEMVEIGDPDGLHSMYEDVGLYDHSEVVSLLFFN